MLDNEPDTDQTNNDGTQSAPPPPRRRRAASRPAGPPATPVPLAVEPTPAVENVDQVPAASPPVSTQEVTVAPEAPQTEMAAPVETSQPEVAASDLVSADPAPVAKTASKRAPRKATAKKAAAEVLPDEAAEQEAAPQKRPARKRTSKKAAEPTATADQAAGQPATVFTAADLGAGQADQGPAGWIAPSAEPTAAPDASQSADATPSADVTPSADATQSASSVLGTAEAPVDGPTPDPVLASSTTERAADSVLAPQDKADAPEADPEAEADEADPDGEDAAHHADVKGEPDDGPPATAPDFSWLADPFAAPAPAAPAPAAPAATDTEDEPSDQTADEGDEDTADDDEPGEGSRRRRRRRGGRRRRRSGGDDEASEGDSESGDDAEQTPRPAASDGSEPAEEAGADEADDSEGEDSEGQRRRRRRRRRRGEDSGTLPDDPSDVVVRVREPRPRKRAASSSEVTGIEGSTRMEAKRQRRREGRDAGRRRAPILSEAEFLARRESVLRQMIIRQGPELAQIAVLEDGILVEHYVDRDSAASLIGNVYLGRVQNVLPSMEAAFVDIGRGRNAVLYAGEVDWDSFGAEGHQRKVERVLKSGQMILVQVTKDPVGAKGARLTNHVSIPGRYVVYAPGGHLSGISRKLPDIERRRLKDILADLVGESASVIVRTAAEGASEDELIRDVNRLKAQWADIERKVKAGNSPQLLYGEPDLTVRIVRDLFTEDFSELVIQGNGSMTDAYDAITGYVSHVAPHLQQRIRRWEPTGEDDLFAEYRLDEQIAKALERKVFLPSGGSLVIDRTEAMTVIDVNTGKFTGSGGNLEATVTSNNLEAAEEIVRQLRLRDVGGIIVIDFIDMVLPANRELLLRRLVECLGRDRTRHQVAEVTSLGLVQMTRKKIGTGLLEAFGTECPHCHGRGYEVHEHPVDSQQQADGGTRDQRGGRDRGRGQDNGQRNGNSRNGSPRTEESQPSGADSGASDGDGETGRSDQGGRSGQGGRSRGGRRGRGGSSDRESVDRDPAERLAEQEPAGKVSEPSAVAQPEAETTPEPATSTA